MTDNLALAEIITLVGYFIGTGFGIGLLIWLIAWGVSAVTKIFRNFING